jgi:hypothetical protein
MDIKKIQFTKPLLQEDEKEETNLEPDKNTSKKLCILTNPDKKSDIKSNIKNIQKKEKEKKMRVETTTWGLNNDDLAFKIQLELLRQIRDSLDNKSLDNKSLDNKLEKDLLNKKEQKMIISHIKTKLSSYKQQDILKKKFSESNFVSFSETINLLNDSNMLCYYCSCETYLLYEIVREMKQWSLDRINNDIGHNKNNLVICCLECNLKRRRTNKDAFFFTKNLKIVKQNHSVESEKDI